MSWKTDKFQPLRDRFANHHATASMVAEARQAQIDAVTQALSPKPERPTTNWFNDLVWTALQRRQIEKFAAHGAKIVRPGKFSNQLAGTQAHAVIVDDLQLSALTLKKLEAAKTKLDAQAASCRHQAEQLQRQALEAIREQIEAHEVTRALLGEPDHDDQPDAVRYAFHFASAIKPDVGVIRTIAV